MCEFLVLLMYLCQIEKFYNCVILQNCDIGILWNGEQHYSTLLLWLGWFYMCVPYILDGIMLYKWYNTLTPSPHLPPPSHTLPWYAFVFMALFILVSNQVLWRIWIVRIYRGILLTRLVVLPGVCVLYLCRDPFVRRTTPNRTQPNPNPTQPKPNLLTTSNRWWSSFSSSSCAVVHFTV